MPARSAMLAAAALAIIGATLAHAQGFPSRVVRVVVPFPAGGTADVLPRIVAEKLSAKWGQPVIVENRSGAGGNIGAEAVARADPDGHTLLAAPPGPIAINHNLYQQLAFDPTKWVPITVLATVPNVLAVKTSLPVSSVKELIALGKANPGKLSFASQGSGSTSHLTAAMFESMAGVQMVHVPYKGTAPALTDLAGGQVDLFFDNLGSSMKQHQAGRIKILAVASEQRAASLPEVPTVAEAGLREFRSVTWFGVVAPPGTRGEIAQRISAAFAEALRMPDVQHRFSELGAETVGNTPAEMAEFVRDETERWQRVIRSANVTLQ